MQIEVSDRSYAVTWIVEGGPARVGKLVLSPQGLRLDGGDPRGQLYSVGLPYRDLAGVHVARSTADRIRRLPTLILERPGLAAIRIATIGGLGLTTELVDRLVPLIASAA